MWDGVCVWGGGGGWGGEGGNQAVEEEKEVRVTSSQPDEEVERTSPS